METCLFRKFHRAYGSSMQYSIQNDMGPYKSGPRSVSYDRAIRYSGSGVCSVGSVGDFLERYYVIWECITLGIQSPSESGNGA